MNEYHAWLKKLEATYGAVAASCRHEIYFLSHNNGALLAVLKAMYTLVRDGVWLTVRANRTAHESNQIYFVVTLPHSNGWKALIKLQESISSASPSKPVVILHPRMRDLAGVAVVRLAPPLLRTILAAFRLQRGCLTASSEKLQNILVYLSCIRFEMWRSAWKNTLSGNRNTLILHNDFDIMSAAAVVAGKGHAKSYCVQHGLPTEEFFPTKADWQITWGPASTKAYVDNGTASDKIIEACFVNRDFSAVTPEAPTRFLLLSQSHTAIYGVNLAALMLEFLQQFKREDLAASDIAVLLHPNEIDGHPYLSTDDYSIQRPPHRELTHASTPALVLAFSSTGLLEAACAGHYVAGIYFEPQQSLSAYHVLKPVNCVHSAQEAVALRKRLCDDVEFRQLYRTQQNAWLASIYGPAVARPQLLARLGL